MKIRGEKKKTSIKKIILTVLCGIAGLVLLLLAGCAIYLLGAKSGKTASNASAGDHTGFYVDGTVLRDANGNAFVMRGINMAHNWYPDKDEVSLDAIAATGSNTVRIVLACGERWDKDDMDTLEKLIEEADRRDMIAVVELHDGTGSDDAASLEAMTDYWVEMACILEGLEDRVIVNIANEWLGDWDDKLWRDAYVEAVKKLRDAGIKNTLMIDAAGWGQWARSIKKYGYDVFEADPEKNTMFSVHMYGLSGGSEWMIRYCLEAAEEQNLCICVGEFGYTHSDGDVKEDYLMQYCEEKGIGYLAWSWKGNSGGVEYLDLALEWDGSSLSADWGEKLVNGKYGIKATSKKCSIFGE